MAAHKSRIRLIGEPIPKQLDFTAKFVNNTGFTLVKPKVVGALDPNESMESKMIAALNEAASKMEVGNQISVYQATQIIKYRCPTWIPIFDRSEAEIIRLGTVLDDEFKRIGVHFVPYKNNLYKALELTPLNKTRVVIIGQDPYPQMLGPNPRAQGLSFSVSYDDVIPGSLKNIYKEINNEIPGFQQPNHGNLEHWAQQGVLLLNSCLTCLSGQAGSHSKYPLWTPFIRHVIKGISEIRPNCIYVMWGREAEKIEPLLGEHNIRLVAAHPSGLSANRGFFGCGHFVEINRLLTSFGEAPIDWSKAP